MEDWAALRGLLRWCGPDPTTVTPSRQGQASDFRTKPVNVLGESGVHRVGQLGVVGVDGHWPGNLSQGRGSQRMEASGDIPGLLS